MLDFGRAVRDCGERVAKEGMDGIFQCQSGSSRSVST